MFKSNVINKVIKFTFVILLFLGFFVALFKGWKIFIAWQKLESITNNQVSFIFGSCILGAWLLTYLSYSLTKKGIYLWNKFKKKPDVTTVADTPQRKSIFKEESQAAMYARKVQERLVQNRNIETDKRHFYKDVFSDDYDQYVNPLVVFISSVLANHETKEERKIAKEAIQEIPPFSTWLFEEAPASPNLLDSYLSEVERCDIFLLILKKSISEAVIKEYRKAKAHGRPILVFVSEDSPESEEVLEFVKNHAIDKNHRYTVFHSSSELRREIRRSILKLNVTYFRNNFPLKYQTFSVCLLAWLMQDDKLVDLWDTSIKSGSFEDFDNHLENTSYPPEENRSSIERITEGINIALTASGLATLSKVFSHKGEVEADTTEATDIQNEYDVLDQFKQNSTHQHDDYSQNNPFDPMQ